MTSPEPPSTGSLVTDHAGVDEDRQAAVEATTEELTALVVDRLLPAAYRYRNEVARSLDLTPIELQCLELLRAHGGLWSGLIGDRTGLSRSTVSTMLRRLEEQGHVRRVPSPTRRQELLAELVPHGTRDVVLADLRRQIRGTVREAVEVHGFHRHERRARTAGFLVQLVHRLQTAAAEHTLDRWREQGARRRREAERAARRRRPSPTRSPDGS